MSTIAITGKGGVGKTTVSALIVRWLVQHGPTPVLAIDADSNANFHELLGISCCATVGGIREEARKIVKADPGTSKHQYLETQIAHALVEDRGFDFLAMGRPEGPGCYCYANNVLRDCIARLAANYRCLVIDCEAGLEHLSRRTVLDVDYLITVSDPSVRGLRTAARVSEVLEEMRTRVHHRGLVINKLDDPAEQLLPEQQEAIAGCRFDLIARLPYDKAVASMDRTGGSVDRLVPDSAVYGAVAGMLQQLGI